MINTLMSLGKTIGGLAVESTLSLTKGLSEGVNTAINSKEGQQDIQEIKDNMKKIGSAFKKNKQIVHETQSYTVKDDNEEFKFNF